MCKRLLIGYRHSLQKGTEDNEPTIFAEACQPALTFHRLLTCINISSSLANNDFGCNDFFVSKIINSSVPTSTHLQRVISFYSLYSGPSVLTLSCMVVA